MKDLKLILLFVVYVFSDLDIWGTLDITEVVKSQKIPHVDFKK